MGSLYHNFSFIAVAGLFVSGLFMFGFALVSGIQLSGELIIGTALILVESTLALAEARGRPREEVPRISKVAAASETRLTLDAPLYVEIEIPEPELE